MISEAISRIFREAKEKTTAKLGLGFLDLQTGETALWNADQAFPTASTFKLFVLAELYRQVAAGEIRLEDRIPLESEDKAFGSGVLALLADGLPLTVHDLAVLMMIISDNTATDKLCSLVGLDRVRANVLEKLELRETRVALNCKDLIDLYYELNGRNIEEALADYGGVVPSFRMSPYYTCEAPLNNQSSPRDMLKMLELLYRGEWVSPEASAGMLEIMKECQTNSRIPYMLPEFLPIAHKTGTIDRFCSDVGIVYAPNGTYALALFYNGNLASEEEYEANDKGQVGDRFLAELSGAVFHAYTQAGRE